MLFFFEKNIRFLFPRLEAIWVSKNKIFSFDMFPILTKLITIQMLDNIKYHYRRLLLVFASTIDEP